jgi:hypothetical protein
LLLFFKVFVAVLSFLTSFVDTFPAFFVRSLIARLAASGAVSLRMQGGEIQLGWVGLEPTTNPESQKALGAARLSLVGGWAEMLEHCNGEFRVLLAL